MARRHWSRRTIILGLLSGILIPLGGAALTVRVTGISADPLPIIVGNGVTYTAVSAGAPPNPVNHYEWRYRCREGACAGNWAPLSQYSEESFTTYEPRIGGIQLEAKAFYDSISDPDTPQPPDPTSAERAFDVLPPDRLAWDWLPSPPVQRFDAFAGVGVEMLWRVRYGDRPIGPAAIPIVEERIYRGPPWSSYSGWSAWSGEEPGRFWYDPHSATLIDVKVTSINLGDGYDDGDKIDEAYQQIRLTFDKCCEGEARWFIFKTVTISRYKVDDEHWRIEATNTPADQVPPG